MPDSVITGGKIHGTYYQYRAGYRFNTNDLDHSFDSLADDILGARSYFTTRGGVLSGFTGTANPSAIPNVLGITGGAAIDVEGEFIYKTASTNLTIGVTDVNRYVCLYYNETVGEIRSSIVMGTVAYMYTYSTPRITLVSNPTVAGDPIRLCKITAVDGLGNVSFDQTVGMYGNRDEYMHYHPQESVNITAVMSSSISGYTEDDMVAIPLPTRTTLLNELNGIKSVIAEWITGGNRYPGAWDDVNSTAGNPGTPTNVTAVAGDMNDLRYNYVVSTD